MVFILAHAMLACPAHADPEQSIPQPTPLEAMLADAGTTVIWKKEVRRLESLGSTAVITAVEAQSADGRFRSGVRVDLASGDSANVFYVDKVLAGQFKQELAGLEPFYPATDLGANCETLSPGRMEGVARCRPSQHVPQAFCPVYYVEADSDCVEGLVLHSQVWSYRFPSVRPSDLFRAIDAAVDAIDTHNLED